nr:MAG TPA: hypothetical protein [Caudoviricetes sp.]
MLKCRDYFLLQECLRLLARSNQANLRNNNLVFLSYYVRFQT